MMRYNSISICPIDRVEPGDLIAMKFLGQVVSGRVDAVVQMVYQLTGPQRRYLWEHNLNIPENKYAHIDCPGMVLVFGQFSGGPSGLSEGHMFLDDHMNVAVLDTKQTKE